MTTSFKLLLFLLPALLAAAPLEIDRIETNFVIVKKPSAVLSNISKYDLYDIWESTSVIEGVEKVSGFVDSVYFLSNRTNEMVFKCVWSGERVNLKKGQLLVDSGRKYATAENTIYGINSASIGARRGFFFEINLGDSFKLGTKTEVTSEYDWFTSTTVETTNSETDVKNGLCVSFLAGYWASSIRSIFSFGKTEMTDFSGLTSYYEVSWSLANKKPRTVKNGILHTAIGLGFALNIDTLQPSFYLDTRGWWIAPYKLHCTYGVKQYMHRNILGLYDYSINMYFGIGMISL